MNKNKDLPQDNLARNLAFLMDRAGDNPLSLSRKLKGLVGQTTIYNILNKEKIARVDTVEHIAGVYGLSGWHLISPNLINDLQKSPTLAALLANYEKADEDGKRHIEQVAEREAKYHITLE